MIEFIILSFVAGILTVAAPCILPLLPVIVGGSIISDTKAQQSLKHPIVIALSLAISIIIFTLLLKATTMFLSVPVALWSGIAGGIVVLFGISLLFPVLWERMMIRTGWQAGGSRLIGRSQQATGIKKDILLGAALGPVFNSCSPTYALIVATVLPASFSAGFVYLVAYALGVATILLLSGLFGRVVVERLKWLSNPEGIFKKTIGVLFIVVGVLVMFGIDKHIQTYVLENGWYDPIMQIEQSLK